ncbi:hypothetical protein I7I48_02422 [Histoplasma ohiense]|nr:hypothetical protein I7I48_02422 [Histoplasma ohiense (nom. inval.)]
MPSFSHSHPWVSKETGRCISLNNWLVCPNSLGTLTIYSNKHVIYHTYLRDWTHWEPDCRSDQQDSQAFHIGKSLT